MDQQRPAARELRADHEHRGGVSVVTATVSWYWLERPINRRRDLPFRQWFQPLARSREPARARDRPEPQAHLEGRFPCFDGLRAIAALMVVFHHAAFTTAFELRGVRVPFTHHTWMVGALLRADGRPACRCSS